MKKPWPMFADFSGITVKPMEVSLTDKDMPQLNLKEGEDAMAQSTITLSASTLMSGNRGMLVEDAVGDAINIFNTVAEAIARAKEQS